MAKRSATAMRRRADKKRKAAGSMKKDDSEDDDDESSSSEASSVEDSAPSIPPRIDTKKVSGWLAKFLAKDRSEIVSEEGPDKLPTNDYVVEAFAERRREENFVSTFATKSDDDDDATMEEEEAKLGGDDDLEEPSEAAASEGVNGVFVSNLHYSTNEEKLKEVLEQFGEVVKITLPAVKEGMPNAGRPAGYALASFANAKAAQECVSQLNNKRFLGRDLRVRFDQKKAKSKPQAERYYNTLLAKPKKTNPCSFCGNEGHLPDDCPDRVCPYCLLRGHDAHTCKEPRHKSLGDVELCTNCGRWGHTWMWCEENDGDARLADEKVRCLVCGRRGHLDCTPLSAQSPTTDVFCSWCGLKGHTQPSCPAKGIINVLKAENKREPPKTMDRRDRSPPRRARDEPPRKHHRFDDNSPRQDRGRQQSSSSGFSDRRASGGRRDYDNRRDHHRSRR